MDNLSQFANQARLVCANHHALCADWRVGCHDDRPKPAVSIVPAVNDELVVDCVEDGFHGIVRPISAAARTMARRVAA